MKNQIYNLHLQFKCYNLHVITSIEHFLYSDNSFMHEINDKRRNIYKQIDSLS